VIAAKLAEETSQALARATGLRNIVAHVDAQADPDLVFRAATSGLEGLERFSREVAGWVPGTGASLTAGGSEELVIHESRRHRNLLREL